MPRRERQRAFRKVTGSHEQEIQRPLTKTRLEVEEAVRNTATGGAASADVLQRIEKAYLELTRIEAILNEVLDFAKPLDLHPRVVRIPEDLDRRLAGITEDLGKNAITVTRDCFSSFPA